jgi:hypothetical protein
VVVAAVAAVVVAVDVAIKTRTVVATLVMDLTSTLTNRHPQTMQRIRMPNMVATKTMWPSGTSP